MGVGLASPWAPAHSHCFLLLVCPSLFLPIFLVKIPTSGPLAALRLSRAPGSGGPAHPPPQGRAGALAALQACSCFCFCPRLLLGLRGVLWHLWLWARGGAGLQVPRKAALCPVRGWGLLKTGLGACVPPCPCSLDAPVTLCGHLRPRSLLSHSRPEGRTGSQVGSWQLGELLFTLGYLVLWRGDGLVPLPPDTLLPSLHSLPGPLIDRWVCTEPVRQVRRPRAETLRRRSAAAVLGAPGFWPGLQRWHLGCGCERG